MGLFWTAEVEGPSGFFELERLSGCGLGNCLTKAQAIEDGFSEWWCGFLLPTELKKGLEGLLLFGGEAIAPEELLQATDSIEAADTAGIAQLGEGGFKLA